MYARPFMNQIIHVTGAASGIGRAAALAFVKKGHLSMALPATRMTQRRPFQAAGA